MDLPNDSPISGHQVKNRNEEQKNGYLAGGGKRKCLNDIGNCPSQPKRALSCFRIFPGDAFDGFVSRASSVITSVMIHFFSRRSGFIINSLA
jgi:hypothetical protein